MALGVYEIKVGTLTCTWIPVNATDKTVLGFENLTDPTPPGGTYKISVGKLPDGRAAYTRALTIEPLAAILADSAKCYRIRWSTGTTAVGFVPGKKLIVATCWDTDFEALLILAVDLLNKSSAPGTYNLLR